ncbi:MAG: hypothetical protein QXK76_02085 [Candidatus Woesearchaeota archaeon]
MHKKGSMELSVNSIVILVIAVVMMGLILGFIKSKFSDISKDIIKDEPEAPDASSSEPITLSRYSMVVSPAKREAIKIKFFNTKAETINKAAPVFQCKGGLAITGDFFEKNVASATQASYDGTIKVNAANKDTYLCKVCIIGYIGNTEPSSSRPTNCDGSNVWYVSESKEFRVTLQ